MVDRRLLEKTLSKAVATGRCIFGLKEVSRSLRGSKLVVYSSSFPNEKLEEFIKKCKALSIPVVAYEDTSFSLGRVCGKPFRISVMSVKSSGEADLKPIIEGLHESSS